MHDSPSKSFGRSDTSLAHNALWLFLGQGTSVAFQALYFILLARLLGSTEYGIFVGVAALVAIFSQYSTLGTYSVLLRYVSVDPKQFAPYWGNVLVTTVTLGTLFVVVLSVVGPHIAHSYPARMIAMVAISDCLCAQVTLSAGRVFQAFQKMRFTASLSLITNVLRSIAAGFMLIRWHHSTAQEWVVAAVAVSIVSLAVAMALVSWNFGLPTFSGSLLRSRIGQGMIFALSYSTGYIYNDVDKAMLGHYGMNAAAGIYAMAYRVVDVGAMPFNSIQAAAFPRFFQKGVAGAGEAMRYALQIISRTVPIAIVCSAAIFLLAPIIPYIAGPSFAPSVTALRWLSLIPIFRSLHISAGDALTGSNHQPWRLAAQAAVSVLNLGLNLFLIPKYGWLGAAWSSLFTDSFLVVINWTMLQVLARRDLRLVTCTAS